MREEKKNYRVFSTKPWVLLLFVVTVSNNAIFMGILFCSGWIHQHPNNFHRRFQARPFHSTTTARKGTTVASIPTTTATTDGPNNDISAEEYRQLYPKATSVSNGTIATKDGIHTLYYEIHGSGPLHSLFLHGGPGSGCFPNHARFFDPTRYTVILLDQRGAGRSRPRGSVVNNTLSYLVDDCELLRTHLIIDRWDVILGGSWGTTLALAYAQTYPTSMRSLILRGICTLRPSEVDWLFSSNGGSALQLAEEWKKFSDVGDSNNNNADHSSDGGREVLHSYYDILNTAIDGDNNCSKINADTYNSIRLAAAKSWMMWEMAVTSSYKRQQQTTDDDGNNDDPHNNIVLVSKSRNKKWLFENHSGEEVIMNDDNKFARSSPQVTLSQLRQGIQDMKNVSTCDKCEEDYIREKSGPRSVRPIQSIDTSTSNDDASHSNDTNATFRVPPDFIPAQVMLTCFYSVNDVFVIGDRYKNLLSKESCSRLDENLRIIGIQGGLDPICPPDTALDLKSNCDSLKRNMELRIPLNSGHSMYDPAIANELIRATDKLANDLSS